MYYTVSLSTFAQIISKAIAAHLVQDNCYETLLRLAQSLESACGLSAGASTREKNVVIGSMWGKKGIYMLFSLIPLSKE